MIGTGVGTPRDQRVGALLLPRAGGSTTLASKGRALAVVGGNDSPSHARGERTDEMPTSRTIGHVERNTSG
jgi:hypothetical protein